MILDFERQRSEWERIPVDSLGDYFSAGELLRLEPDALRGLVSDVERERYAIGGWRNFRNGWRNALGMDSTHGKLVLDFGCGMGVDALQFARAGNRLFVADINPSSVELAVTVLRLFGFSGVGLEALVQPPFISVREKVDVFFSCGVLHHTPLAPDVLRRAAQLLRPDGEVRLMLYSDQGWRVATGTEPPEGDPREHPEYERFLRFFDGVGFYSEPWWAEKLQRAVEGVLELRSWVYITRDDRYAVARLGLP